MTVEQNNLRRAAAFGVIWGGAGSAIMTAAHLVQLMVLVRVLEPGDFGVMGMALVVIGVCRAFADGGLSHGVIAHQATSREQLSSLYWCNVLAGWVVFGCAWSAAPMFAGYFQESRVTEVLRWSALAFVVVPLGQQMRVLMQRELEFGRIAAIECTGAIAGAAAAISAAMCGWGVFALVWSQLAGAAVEAMLLLAAGWSRWRPLLRLSWRDVRPLAGFGVFQMGERCVNQLAANIDYIVIGRVLGADALGVYRVAYQLVVQTLVKVNPLVTRVAFPVLARKQTDNVALQRGYSHMQHVLSMIVWPVMIGLAVCAPQAVPLLLGETWGGATAIVQVLCVVGAMKAMGNPIGSLLLAKRRADATFLWTVVTLVVNAAVFTIAARWGIMAVAGTYAVLSVVYFGCLSAGVLPRVIGLSLKRQWRSMAGAIAAAACMGGLVWMIGLVGHRHDIEDGMLLLLQIAVGVVAYGTLVGTAQRNTLAALWRSIRPSPMGEAH